MNRTHCYEFWIANMSHYTVAVTDGAPVTVWVDDLDHRRPVLEWRAGEEQSRDVATALATFRKRWPYRFPGTRPSNESGGRIASCQGPRPGNRPSSVTSTLGPIIRP
jgi:hypothetical protein